MVTTATKTRIKSPAESTGKDNRTSRTKSDSAKKWRDAVDFFFSDKSRIYGQQVVVTVTARIPWAVSSTAPVYCYHGSSRRTAVDRRAGTITNRRTAVVRRSERLHLSTYINDARDNVAP